MTAFDWVFAAVALAFSLFLMIRYFRLHRISELNVISLMYISHCLAQLAPSYAMLFDPALRYAVSYFAACVLTAVLIPIGGLLGDALYPARDRRHVAFLGTPTDASAGTIAATRSLVLVGTVVAALLLVMIVTTSKTYAFKAMLVGVSGWDELDAMRDDAIESGGYLFGIAQMLVMPVLFAVTVANWRYLNVGIFPVLRWALLAMILVHNSYATRKTPIAILFVLGLIIWFHKHLQARRLREAAGTPPRKSLIRRMLPLVGCVGGAIGYPFFIFMNKAVGQTQTLEYIIFWGIFGRIFYKPAANSYYAFEIFPRAMEFTWFADIEKFATVFGLKRFDLSGMTAFYRFGLVSNAPPPSIGTFFAQAGWPMVVVGVLAAAAIFKICENAFLNLRRRTATDAALYAFFLYGSFRFSWGYFHSILFSECIMPVMLLLILWHRVIQNDGRGTAAPRLAPAE